MERRLHNKLIDRNKWIIVVAVLLFRAQRGKVKNIIYILNKNYDQLSVFTIKVFLELKTAFILRILFFSNISPFRTYGNLQSVINWLEKHKQKNCREVNHSKGTLRNEWKEYKVRKGSKFVKRKNHHIRLIELNMMKNKRFTFFQKEIIFKVYFPKSWGYVLLKSYMSWA